MKEQWAMRELWDLMILANLFSKYDVRLRGTCICHVVNVYLLQTVWSSEILVLTFSIILLSCLLETFLFVSPILRVQNLYLVRIRNLCIAEQTKRNRMET